MQRNWLAFSAFAFVLLVMGSTPVGAQSSAPGPPPGPAGPVGQVGPGETQSFGRGGRTNLDFTVGPGPQDDIRFLSFESGIGHRVVTGAPYSGQVITEHTQVLADGNTIERKTTMTVYRDGQGRTRREQTLSAIGSYTVLGNPPQVIFINDPVAGVSYVLDPVRKRVRKFTLPQRPPRPDSGQEFQRGNPDATAGVLVEGTLS